MRENLEKSIVRTSAACAAGCDREMNAIIKATRATLRPFKRNDVQSLRKNANDRLVARNLNRLPSPYTLQDARKFVYKKLREQKQKKPQRTFVIDIGGNAAGVITLSRKEDPWREHRAEVGYWLGRRYWGSGIMTEALRAITRYGFYKLHLTRIHASVMVGNRASARILEKAGYKREGMARKYIKKGRKYIDCYLYAKVK